MKRVENVIMPFPKGVVRSGSKVGSKYKALIASTNHIYCPTIKGVVKDSAVPENVNVCYEIVVDGADEKAVADTIIKVMDGAREAGVINSMNRFGKSIYSCKDLFHKII